jgi:cytochrome o ubiquinol oxidase subunit 1
MIIATMAICILSFMVWLHHFFTMGAGADVNGFFGIMTMIIAVPTGVKIFNWLFTMWGGRVRFEVPMLWSIAFMVTFLIGGMTGVLLAVPPADFVLHNSLFLVAHFHNVVIGGVLFGAFAGYTYWFPKAFGFKLDERLGQGRLLVLGHRVLRRLHAALRLGLEGMTRRMQHYDVAEWQPWLIVAAGGAALILVGIGCQMAQLVVSASAIATRCAISPAIPGTAARWNGSPPRRRRLQFRGDAERHRRRSLLGHQAEGDRAAPPHRSARLQADRDAAQQPDRIRRGLLRGRHRLRADLAHLVDGDRRLIGAFATFVAFAWRDHSEYELSAAEVWRDRRRAASGAHRAGGRPRARHQRGPLSGPPRTIRTARHARSPDGGTRARRPKRIVTGYGFWIFLLSDFILFSGFYAAYAVLSHATAGGPPAQAVRPEDGRDRDRFLLLSSFACGMATLASNARNMLWTQIGYAVTGCSASGFWPGVQRVRRMLAKAPGRAAARFCRRSSRWSAATAACDDRPAVARHHDGAILGQGISPRHHAARPVLCAVLARARHHLGRHLHQRLSAGNEPMSEKRHDTDDAAKFWRRGARRPRRSATTASCAGVRNYLIGLALAAGLTIGSFWVASGTSLIYTPGVPDGAGGAGDRRRWACISRSSCTSPPARTTSTTRWRSPSAC